MTSKQSSSIRPFVGQFIFLLAVAFWAGNNNIFGTVGSAARQRDYVIDIVGITNCFVAVIAPSLLGLVLASYVCGSVVARSSTTQRPIKSISSQLLSAVSGVIMPTVHALFFFVSCLMIDVFFLANVALRFSHITQLAMSKQLSICAARFAKEELGSREFKFAAFCAAFEESGKVEHSMFTSCCLPNVCSQGGVNAAFSVANLDYRSIIAPPLRWRKGMEIARC